MLITILKGTPAWVFIFFLALVALGYFQSRDRIISRSRVAITPVAMIALSFYAALSTFRSAGLVFWLAGVGLAVWLGVKRLNPRGLSYLNESKSFFVPGSWLPLGLMMAIFFTQYATAIVHVKEPVSIGAISLFYGICSGVFFARALVLWRALKRTGNNHV